MEERAGMGGGRGRGGGEEGELDPLDVLLEEPVVDEGLLPLRDKLRLQILRELHHLRHRLPSAAVFFDRIQSFMGTYFVRFTA